VSLLLVGASRLGASWDLSEDRRSSFPRVEERALSAVKGLTVSIHLAAEDPRLVDFERGPLLKLRRAVPTLRVVYAASSRTGMFEEDPAYGEIRYQLGGRSAVTRSTTEGVTLEEVFALAGIPRPPRGAGEGTPGHPLAAAPRFAAPLFYAVWPLTAAAFWVRYRRPWRPA
jgi:hypothetical protein